MTAGLVDFHCHLDLYPDHAGMVAECDREGIHALAVTTTPKAWPRNRERAAQTRYVRVALGLHPQLVAERVHELALWEKYLSESRYVGEVGLDAGPRFIQSLDLQKNVFQRILQLCVQTGNKILTIHSVRATTAVLDMIETYLLPSSCRVVLHWFTGSRVEARRAINIGCYFSVNGEMLRSQHHRKLVALLPGDRLLTETDGPFTRHDGRLAHPRDVAAAVDMLSRIRGLHPENVKANVLENLSRLES